MRKIYILFSILLAAFSLQAQTSNYTNSTPITIVDNATASIYSSNISVAGAPTTISDVSVTLNNFSHGAPGDVAIALESPNGQAMIIQEGFWGSTPASGLTYMLSDIGTLQPGVWDLPSGGTFKPTANSMVLPSFDAPGPGATYANPGPSNAGTATMSSTFSAGNPNGTWRLWVLDIAGGSAGSIAGGWTLTINPTTALPVEMEDFELNCISANQIKVDWTTHNEENTKSFIIQSSSDGSFFTDTKEVKAAGNSNIEMHYSVAITRSFDKQFVRIKSVDLNEQFTYSNVLEAICNTQLDISISPNPVVDLFTLNNPSGDFVQYSIVDIRGKILAKGSTSSIGEKISTTDLVPGVYYIKTKRNNQEQTIKFLNK